MKGLSVSIPILIYCFFLLIPFANAIAGQNYYYTQLNMVEKSSQLGTSLGFTVSISPTQLSSSQVNGYGVWTNAVSNSGYWYQVGPSINWPGTPTTSMGAVVVGLDYEGPDGKFIPLPQGSVSYGPAAQNPGAANPQPPTCEAQSCSSPSIPFPVTPNPGDQFQSTVTINPDGTITSTCVDLNIPGDSVSVTFPGQGATSFVSFLPTAGGGVYSGVQVETDGLTLASPIQATIVPSDYSGAFTVSSTAFQAGGSFAPVATYTEATMTQNPDIEYSFTQGSQQIIYGNSGILVNQVSPSTTLQVASPSLSNGCWACVSVENVQTGQSSLTYMQDGSYIMPAGTVLQVTSSSTIQATYPDGTTASLTYTVPPLPEVQTSGGIVEPAPTTGILQLSNPDGSPAGVVLGSALPGTTLCIQCLTVTSGGQSVGTVASLPNVYDGVTISSVTPLEQSGATGIIATIGGAQYEFISTGGDSYGIYIQNGGPGSAFTTQIGTFTGNVGGITSGTTLGSTQQPPDVGLNEVYPAVNLAGGQISTDAINFVSLYDLGSGLSTTVLDSTVIPTGSQITISSLNIGTQGISGTATVQLYGFPEPTTLNLNVVQEGVCASDGCTYYLSVPYSGTTYSGSVISDPNVQDVVAIINTPTSITTGTTLSLTSSSVISTGTSGTPSAQAHADDESFLNIWNNPTPLDQSQLDALTDTIDVPDDFSLDQALSQYCPPLTCYDVTSTSDDGTTYSELYSFGDIPMGAITDDPDGIIQFTDTDGWTTVIGLSDQSTAPDTGITLSSDGASGAFPLTEPVGTPEYDQATSMVGGCASDSSYGGGSSAVCSNVAQAATQQDWFSYCNNGCWSGIATGTANFFAFLAGKESFLSAIESLGPALASPTALYLINNYNLLPSSLNGLVGPLGAAFSAFGCLSSPSALGCYNAFIAAVNAGLTQLGFKSLDTYLAQALGVSQTVAQNIIPGIGFVISVITGGANVKIPIQPETFTTTFTQTPYNSVIVVGNSLSYSPVSEVSQYNFDNATYFLTCPSAASSMPTSDVDIYPNKAAGVAGNECVATNTTYNTTLYGMATHIIVPRIDEYFHIVSMAVSGSPGYVADVSKLNLSYIGQPQLLDVGYSPSVDGVLSDGWDTNSYLFDQVPPSAQHGIWSWDYVAPDFSLAHSVKSQLFATTLNVFDICPFTGPYLEETTLDSISPLYIPFVEVLNDDASNTVTVNTDVYPYFDYSYDLVSNISEDSAQGSLIGMSEDLFSPWNYYNASNTLDEFKIDLPSLFFSNSSSNVLMTQPANYSGLAANMPDTPVGRGTIAGNLTDPISAAATMDNYVYVLYYNKSTPADLGSQSIPIANIILDYGAYAGAVNQGIDPTTILTSQPVNVINIMAGQHVILTSGVFNVSAAFDYYWYNSTQPGICPDFSYTGVSDQSYTVAPNTTQYYCLQAVPTSDYDDSVPAYSYSIEIDVTGTPPPAAPQQGPGYNIAVIRTFPKGTFTPTDIPLPQESLTCENSCDESWNAIWQGYWAKVINEENNSAYILRQIPISSILSNDGMPSEMIYNISVDNDGDAYLVGNTEVSGQNYAFIAEVSGITNSTGNLCAEPCGALTWSLVHSNFTEIAAAPVKGNIYLADPSNGSIAVYNNTFVYKGSIPLVFANYTVISNPGIELNQQNPVETTGILNISYWLANNGLFNTGIETSTGTAASSYLDNSLYHHPLAMDDIDGYLYVLDEWNGIAGSTEFNLLDIRILDPGVGEVPLNAANFSDLNKFSSTYTSGSANYIAEPNALPISAAIQHEYPPFGWILSGTVGQDSFCSFTACTYNPENLNPEYYPVGPELYQTGCAPGCRVSLSVGPYGNLALLSKQTEGETPFEGNELILADFAPENYTNPTQGLPTYSCYVDTGTSPICSSYLGVNGIYAPILLLSDQFKETENTGSYSVLTASSIYSSEVASTNDILPTQGISNACITEISEFTNTPDCDNLLSQQESSASSGNDDFGSAYLALLQGSEAIAQPFNQIDQKALLSNLTNALSENAYVFDGNQIFLTNVTEFVDSANQYNNDAPNDIPEWDTNDNPSMANAMLDQAAQFQDQDSFVANEIATVQEAESSNSLLASELMGDASINYQQALSVEESTLSSVVSSENTQDAFAANQMKALENEFAIQVTELQMEMNELGQLDVQQQQSESYTNGNIIYSTTTTPLNQLSSEVSGEVLVGYKYTYDTWQFWGPFVATLPACNFGLLGLSSHIPLILPPVWSDDQYTTYAYNVTPVSLSQPLSEPVEGGPTYIQYVNPATGSATGIYTPNLSDTSLFLSQHILLNVTGDRAFGALFVANASADGSNYDILNATQQLQYKMVTMNIGPSLNYTMIVSNEVGQNYGPGYSGTNANILDTQTELYFLQQVNQPPYYNLPVGNSYDTSLYSATLDFYAPQFLGYNRLLYAFTDRFNNTIYMPIDTDIANQTSLIVNVNPQADSNNGNQSTLVINGTAGQYVSNTVSGTGSSTFVPLQNANIYLYYNKDINYIDPTNQILCAFGGPLPQATDDCTLSNPAFIGMGNNANTINYNPDFNALGECPLLPSNTLATQQVTCNIFGVDNHGTQIPASCAPSPTGVERYCVPEFANGSGTCTSQLGLIGIATTNVIGAFSLNTITCGGSMSSITASYYGPPNSQPETVYQVPLTQSASEFTAQSYTPIAYRITSQVQAFKALDYNWQPTSSIALFQPGAVLLSYGNVFAASIAVLIIVLLIIFILSKRKKTARETRTSRSPNKNKSK